MVCDLQESSSKNIVIIQIFVFIHYYTEVAPPTCRGKMFSMTCEVIRQRGQILPQICLD